MSTFENILHTFTLQPRDLWMICAGTVLFLLLYQVLGKFVFQPHLEHLESRESATAGATETAQLMRQKAAALKARYDEALLHARISATKERMGMIAQAQEEATSIVSTAEEAASRKIAAARTELEAETKRTLANADREAQALAELLVSRVDSQLTVH